MTFIQLVYPNLSQRTEAGWCLKFSQDSFSAPRMYASATDAANATTRRHFAREMPNVAVPVWFDHWGTYQGRYANWGHVVVWVPGRGFLSSPAAGYGQLWLSSIEAVERTFNSKYRFWSEDINGLRVAEPTPKPAPKPTPIPRQEEEDYMEPLYITDNIETNPYWAVNPVTGKRRKISRAEWDAIVDKAKSDGLKPVLTEVSTNELVKIAVV